METAGWIDNLVCVCVCVCEERCNDLFGMAWRWKMKKEKIHSISLFRSGMLQTIVGIVDRAHTSLYRTKPSKACIPGWWKWSHASEGGKSCFFFHFQQIVWISIHLQLRAYLQADLLALFRPSSGDFISLKVFSWISVLVSQKPWHIECTVGTLKEKGKADKTHCKTTKTNTNSLQSYDQK